MKYYGRNQLNEISLKDGEHLKNEYPEGFSKVDIKEGQVGKLSIVKFTVTREEIGLHNLRLIRDGQRRRIVPPGVYTKLIFDGRAILMSDTPAEAHEHYDAYKKATGNVIVNGLGLGFYLKAILTKPDVKSITVIEKSKNVIKLVGPSIQDNRVKIINADAMTWQPPKDSKFDFAWHDIWNNICEDNKDEMKKLKSNYKGIAKKQACWSEEYL